MGKDPNSLHPEVLRRWLIAKERWEQSHPNGPRVILTQAKRTAAEQAALYAQGRTKPGKVVTNARTATQSPHGHGLAFDVAFVDKDGDIDWDDLAPFLAFGPIIESVGLEWGGRWRKKDYPHAEPLNFKGSDPSTHKNPVFGPIREWAPVGKPLARLDAREREPEPEPTPEPQVVATAQETPAIAVVAAAAVPPTVPVPGGGPDDPVRKVTSGSRSWYATYAAIATGAVTLAKENFAAFMGLSREVHILLLVMFALGAWVFIHYKSKAETQIRDNASDPTRANTK
jgi:hypothetical protein